MTDKSNSRYCLATLVLLLLMLCASTMGKTIYVDDDAAGANDGSSWTNAYIYLQDALADADSAEKPVEIRVAQGVYTPDKGTGMTRGNRGAAFQLIDGIAVRGGFAGVGAIEPDDRNIEVYMTILSGDLAGDDADVDDLDELSDHPTRAENSNTVVRGKETDQTAVLDGVTVTSGENGMVNDSGDPTVVNCTFTNSSTGMYNHFCSPGLTNCTFVGLWLHAIGQSGGSLTLINCMFTGNTGGAIDCSLHAELTLQDCTFIDNESNFPIISCFLQKNLRMYNCVFRNNIINFIAGVRVRVDEEFVADNCIFAGNIGMPILLHGGHMVISNCIFAGNIGGFFSGGILSESPDATIQSCTFSGNSSDHDGSALDLQEGGNVSNCIFWDNIQPAIDTRDDELFISYCNVQGGWPGEGNIDVDPYFVMPGYWDLNDTPEDTTDDFWVDGDYHLKSQAGRWDLVSESWVRDDVTSPCIDAGDPNNLVGDEPEPNGGIINMGAYGGTLKASKTYILAKIIYVDDDATGANDGTNWENAYAYLQDALADANSAEKPVEIRVAQGFYMPDQGAIQTPGDRMATYQLLSDVTIQGGYAGVAEANPDARDIELYETILSGDLNDDDIEVISSDDLRGESSRAENSYQIVTGSETDETAVLDGFTITGGNADVFTNRNGGGLLNEYGAPQIINCKFSENSAQYYGGAIYNYHGNPTLINCAFTQNSSETGGGIFNYYGDPTLINCAFTQNSSGTGGGINNSGGNLTITNCTFIDNRASAGGGTYSRMGNANITNCTFIGNWAEKWGGGIYCTGDNSSLTNCIFSENSADYGGGGMYCDDGNLILADCIFSENTAFYGGGMYNSGSPILTNCTFSQNSGRDYGGGMYNEESPILSNCSFNGNSSSSHGGAIYDTGHDPIFNNCIFSGNTARRYGGAISCGGTRSILTNCTFSLNSAPDGNALAFNANRSSTIELNSCILWNGGDEIWNNDNSEIVVAYSDVQGGWPGVGNIDDDPLFASPGFWADVNGANIVVGPNDPNAVWVNGDYHLKSQAGRWDPVSESWLIDNVTSPCIDAGDPNSLVGDEPEPNSGIINMGAFGGSVEASKSP